MGAGVTLQTLSRLYGLGLAIGRDVSRARELPALPGATSGVSVRGAQGREMTLLGLRASTVYQSV